MAPSGGAETRGQAPRRREEAAPAGRGEAGRGRLPGPARRDLGAIISKNKGSWGRPGAPPLPPPGLALNLNLYLTLCPEGGEGTPLSQDGAPARTSRAGARASTPPSAPGGSPASPGAPGCKGSGVPAPSSEGRGANEASGLRLEESAGALRLPPHSPTLARPAAVAALGRSDSLHVASAAAIQPLIER